jgi:hypothetical protein
MPQPAPPSLPVPAAAGQSAWLPAEDQARVNKAIDRGVEFLRQKQDGGGSWPWGFGAHPVGLAALGGLTLLECGVPAGDENVQRALRLVRSSVPAMQNTYDLGLSILFLDRLGEAADRPLIQTLALRLLAGQTPSGGWTYHCPLLTPPMERNLLTVLRHQQPAPLAGEPAAQARPGPSATPAAPATPAPGKTTQVPTGGSSSPSGGTVPLTGPALAAPEPRPDAAAAKKALDALPVPLRHIPALHEPAPVNRAPNFDGSDNSNTQFAILGVWVAGRHGVPTERALHHIARRFRASQAPGGGWGYQYAVPGNAESPAMTGAGLLGLAVGLGLAEPDRAAGDRKEGPPKDPAVEKGLRALAQAIGKPPGQARGRWLEPGWGRADVNLYFLWTLERVGVLYNLRHINGKDWYSWGADLLVGSQNEDGSWNQGGYPGAVGNVASVDTCLALLFLKRANFVEDLSRRLEFVIDVRSLHGRPGPP